MKKMVLAILVSGLAFFTKQTCNMNNINACFKKSGAEFIKESVCGWSEIKTDDSPEAAAESIFNSMNLQNASSKGWKNGMYYITASSNGLEIVVKTMYVDSQGSIYAYVEYSQLDSIMNINNMRRSIEDAFCVYDAKAFYSVLIQGKYNKKMTLEEMNERAVSLIKASSASYIDGMADGGLVSVCAFSKLLPSQEARVVNGKKINLNIALRASETNSCTYIWIGYPIITIEY
jgi:hypothetical protein